MSQLLQNVLSRIKGLECAETISRELALSIQAQINKTTLDDEAVTWLAKMLNAEVELSTFRENIPQALKDPVGEQLSDLVWQLYVQVKLNKALELVNSNLLKIREYIPSESYELRFFENFQSEIRQAYQLEAGVDLLGRVALLIEETYPCMQYLGGQLDMLLNAETPYQELLSIINTCPNIGGAAWSVKLCQFVVYLNLLLRYQRAREVGINLNHFPTENVKNLFQIVLHHIEALRKAGIHKNFSNGVDCCDHKEAEYLNALTQILISTCGLALGTCAPEVYQSLAEAAEGRGSLLVRTAGLTLFLFGLCLLTAALLMPPTLAFCPGVFGLTQQLSLITLSLIGAGTFMVGSGVSFGLMKLGFYAYNAGRQCGLSKGMSDLELAIKAATKNEPVRASRWSRPSFEEIGSSGGAVTGHNLRLVG